MTVTNKALYYECHITIEPVFGLRLEILKNICSKFGFKVADLLMAKREVDLPERSRFDTFCTGHSNSYEQLKFKMRECINTLHEHEFVVWRYKIKEVVLDSKVGDTLNLLKLKEK